MFSTPLPLHLDNTYQISYDICMLENIYFVLKDDIAEALSADMALSRSAASVLIDHQ